MAQNKEQQKKLLIEIMEADARDGLYKHQTAVEWLESQLDWLSRDMSERDRISLFEQAKQMEKEQHYETWIDSRTECKGDDYVGKEKTFEQYYNETYGKE